MESITPAAVAKHRWHLCAALAAMAWVSTAPAADAPEVAIAANIGLASDYVSRGLALNWNRPALQGSAESLHRSGAYVGGAFSQVSDHYYANGSVELDLYVGLRRPLDETLTYDIGLAGYFYPGADYRHAAPLGAYPRQRYDTVEAVFGLTYRWLNLKYSRCLTDYYGYDSQTAPLSLWNSGVTGGVLPGQGTRGSAYVEANVALDLGRGWSSQWHVGRQQVAHSRKLGYLDFKVGIAKALPDDWSATLAWSTTRGAGIYDDYPSVTGNGASRDIGGRHWLLSVNKAF